MKPISSRCFVVVLAGALGACAALPSQQQQGPRAAAAAPELVPSDVDESGRMQGIVVNRRYGDFFMIDGKEVHREIELAWDYGRGTAIRPGSRQVPKARSHSDHVTPWFTSGWPKWWWKWWRRSQRWYRLRGARRWAR